jgi:hypothetical protein
MLLAPNQPKDQTLKKKKNGRSIYEASLIHNETSNSRICSPENPHALHENPLHLSKDSARCAVSQI